ncbi:MAG: hypothetical protein E7319_10875 [Clostridiales bacterium]|nr:hypothetical protein [Clostridiales bacterium]
MAILITDSSSGVYIASQTGEVLQGLPCPFASPYMPSASPEHLVYACRSARDCLCIHRRDEKDSLFLPAMPAMGAVCLSHCGRYLYQLSTEADCVHTLHLGTGELCYAMPTGVFPRSMRLSQDDHELLVAGGAVNEAYLLRTPDLTLLRTIHTRHPCFSADFWQGGYVLLCAAEGSELQSILYTLSPKTLRPREKLRLPGQPGGLCVCPDGLTALLSTPDGLMKVDIATGELLWNQPEWSLCMQIHTRENLALISDTLCGRVCLMSHEEPWKQRILLQGVDAQACFC